MNKLILVLLIFGIVFFAGSCQLSEADDTVLTNHSDKPVKVKLKGYNEIELAPGKSIAIETKSDMNPGSRMEKFSPDKRVYYKYTNSSLRFDFYNRISYKVKIFNFSGQAGTLTDDDWMDTIYFAEDTEQEDEKWLVYRLNPKFSAHTATDTKFPMSVLVDFENNEFKITIGN